EDLARLQRDQQPQIVLVPSQGQPELPDDLAALRSGGHAPGGKRGRRPLDSPVVVCHYSHPHTAQGLTGGRVERRDFFAAGWIIVTAGYRRVLVVDAEPGQKFADHHLLRRTGTLWRLYAERSR